MHYVLYDKSDVEVVLNVTFTCEDVWKKDTEQVKLIKSFSVPFRI